VITGLLLCASALLGVAAWALHGELERPLRRACIALAAIGAASALAVALAL
jgi:hypothetical protein